MIDPRKITTSGMKTVAILRDTGDGGFAIAKIRAANGAEHYGMRWNGDDDQPRGYPTARGYPVWFVIPEEVAIVLTNHYGKGK